MSRLLILPVLLLLACGDQPFAPEAPEAPSFDFLNNPDNGNPRIYRTEGHFVISWTGDGTLRATHATYEFNPGCGPIEESPIGFQEVGVFDPGDVVSSQLRVNAMGRIWITVRDLSEPGDCYGSKLVASGWGNFHTTDNDRFGSGQGYHNANAWGFMAQGMLQTPDGERVRYAGHLRLTATAAGVLRANTSVVLK